MKKLVLLLLIAACASTAFAAAPVGKWGFGFEGLTVTSNARTLPTVQYYLNQNMAIEGGLSYISQSTGTSSNYTIALALKNRLAMSLGEIMPYWTIGLAYTSNPALVNSTTDTALVFGLGAEYFITPAFSLDGNICVLSYNSFAAGGATTTQLSLLNASGFLPPVVIGAHLYL